MAPYRPKSLDELNQAYDKSKEAQQPAAPVPQPMPAPEPPVAPQPMPQPTPAPPTFVNAVRSKESAQALSGAADDFVKQFSEKEPAKRSALDTAANAADGAAAKAKEELQQETDKAFDDLLSFPSLDRTPLEPPPYHRYTNEEAPIKEGDLSGLMDEYIAVMTDQDGDEETKHSLFRRRKNRKKEPDTLFDIETAAAPVDETPPPAAEPVPAPAPVEMPAQEPATPAQTPVEMPAEEPAAPAQAPVEMPAEEPAAPAQTPVEMPAAAQAAVAAAAAAAAKPAEPKPKRSIDMDPEPVFDPRRLFFDLDEAIAAAQASEVPADEPAEAHAEVPVEEPAESPVEAPVEEPAEAPVEAPVEEPAEAPVELPVELPVDEPAEAPFSEEPAEQPDVYPAAFEDIVSYSDSYDDTDRFTPQPEPEAEDAPEQAADAAEPDAPQDEAQPEEDDAVDDYQVEVVLRPSKVKRCFKVIVTLLILLSLLASLAVGAIGTILNVNTGKSAFGDYYFFAVSNDYSAVSIRSGDLVLAKHKRPLELQDVAVYVDPDTRSFSFGKTEKAEPDPENVFAQLYGLSGIPVKEENVLGVIRFTLPQCGKIVRMVLADFYTYLGACLGAFLFLLLIRAIFLRKKRVLVSAQEAEEMRGSRKKQKKEKQPKEKPQKEKKAKKEKAKAEAEEKAPAYAAPQKSDGDLFDDID